ncbi:hypothetical protein LISE100100_13260 [Listeria seeligeri]|uniref:hypothetical protein n=1 Tax=Listeria seeligeri TaxID=1640 RepID=UPI0001C4E417|nr:hypothetical protein [Listeria seeligeri]CBH26225.1 membrane protein, putative [Listeria seeligeri serovar 1/2b str. SLCC3954]
MEINAEQVYTLNFTMRLRLDPLQNKKLLKLSVLVILFFNWAQRDFLGELPGYFGSTKLNLILIAIAMLFYLILSPKKLTVRFQAAQYLLSICCLQWVIFTVAKFFYVLFFYTLQQETYIYCLCCFFNTMAYIFCVFLSLFWEEINKRGFSGKLRDAKET